MYKISTLFFPKRDIFIIICTPSLFPDFADYRLTYSIISPAKKQKCCSQKSPCPWPYSNLSLLISHMAICFFTNVPANAQYYRLLVVNNPFYYLVVNNGIVFSQLEICEVYLKFEVNNHIGMGKRLLLPGELNYRGENGAKAHKREETLTLLGSN